jgi:hypothetical protein
LKSQKESGKIKTINEGLRKFYEQQGHAKLKTVQQWNAEGKQVKQGEKALLLWGKPQPSKQNPKQNFFPMHFVFSAKQVQPFSNQ